MSTTLANNYYLKALDNYPYDLPDFLESISYALSYDENHADAHYLMGRYYMEQVFKYNQAQYHYEMALVNDINHIETYYHFIRLFILTNELEKAEKLIEQATKIKGIYIPALLHRKAVIFEIRKNYKKALQWINKAIEDAYFTDDRDFYKREKDRIKDKMPKKKKRKKKN